MDKKMLVVCGPTATGKTKLALRLAKKFNGELVSADSRQVYRGIDVGTGKDLPKKFIIHNSYLITRCKDRSYKLSPYELEGIPLWMLDVVDPDEEFSVSHYKTLAEPVIKDIYKRGKLPIVVGGTGLYITSLLSPIETSHIPPNKTLRKQLDGYDLPKLQLLLQIIDTSAFERMNHSDQRNPRRLIRKIEIAQYGRDKDIKRLREKEKKNALIIGLTAPYPTLYKHIDERVEKRVKQGVVDEIKTLLGKGYTWDLPSMNTFGYKEWKDYFDLSPVTCHLSQNEIKKRWKYDEHAYARRQMIWFRKTPGIHWFDIQNPLYRDEVETLVKGWYTKKGYAQKS